VISFARVIAFVVDTFNRLFPAAIQCILFSIRFDSPIEVQIRMKENNWKERKKERKEKETT